MNVKASPLELKTFQRECSCHQSEQGEEVGTESAMPHEITQVSCRVAEGGHKVNDFLIRMKLCQDFEVLQQLNYMLICEQHAARPGTDAFQYPNRNLTCFSYFSHYRVLTFISTKRDSYKVVNTFKQHIGITNN